MPKILVVDDNAYIRAILANHIQSDGFATEEAADGVAAMEKAAGCDLILLDVMMPGMSGLEVLQKLKASPTTSAIPVVMISAYGQRENIIRAARAGAADFIVKPFTRDLVLEKIRKNLVV